jgi:hypothetical protein
MVRLYGKRVALLSVAAVLLVGGGWFWLRDASAAACSGVRQHGVSVNGGPLVNAVTNGAITITRGGTTTLPDGRQVTALNVEDTFTHGKVEGLGDLVITLDDTRQSPRSTLTSHKAGSAFPATQEINFFPAFVLNGEVFRAEQPANVVNSNVSSFPPAPGTVYVLTNSMTLRSEEGNTMTLTPGKAFTIGG